jgi:hypothetical protein
MLGFCAGTTRTSYFKLNVAQNGASIWQNDCRQVSHMGSRFDNNTATRGSPGIEMNQITQADITQCTFTTGNALKGGGLYLQVSLLPLSHVYLGRRVNPIVQLMLRSACLPLVIPREAPASAFRSCAGCWLCKTLLDNSSCGLYGQPLNFRTHVRMTSMWTPDSCAVLRLSCSFGYVRDCVRTSVPKGSPGDACRAFRGR